ncbi:MAG: type II secretion system protein GspM [Methylococcales bacterium]|nr:type II secretion system protein GspM [Methylococcales bacterium]
MNKLKQIDFSSPAIQQRLLAVGILLLVVILFVLLIITPLVSKALELNETKSNLVFKLQQYERILAKSDLVTESMANITKAQDNQGYFNLQETDALASADMQEFIKKAIVDAGGQLSSTQALPVSNKDDFKRITVSVRMTGNSEVLRSVLYKIETSEPLIIINQIDIRPMRGTRNKITRQLEASNELNVNFQAVSFMRNPE